jgi:hypothetical protein
VLVHFNNNSNIIFIFNFCVPKLGMWRYNTRTEILKPVWHQYGTYIFLERRDDRKKKVSGFCRSRGYVWDTLIDRSFVHGLEKTHGASFLNRARNSCCYVIADAWCVFSKPYTKLTLLCNDRCGHLKTEHTESLFLLPRHLGNLPRGPAVSMRSELLVAHEKHGVLPLLTVYVVPV